MLQGSVEAQMTVILKGLAHCLTDYLTVTLTHMRPETWWDDLVLPCLSYQQAQRVKQRCVCNLKSLDLAALLRVLDENWWDIANKMSLPGEGRHYLKELQSVRNRWAHVGAGEDLSGYVYRDFDTVQRLVNILAPDDALGTEIENLKNLTLRPGAPPAALAPQAEHAPICPDEPAPPPDPVGVFKPGDLVMLRSDPAQIVAILSRLPGRPEDRYEVLHNGQRQSFYASQLLAVTGSPEENAESVSAERFQAALTAAQVVHPGASSLFSLNAARIDFIPYQFRPVIKFIRSDCPRLLIADSVGVGKTIEAGLILRELAARASLESVLIICPKPLVAEQKWLSEMKRFSERFEHLDSRSLQLLLDDYREQGDLDPKKSRVIVPYSILDSKLYEGETGRFRRAGLKDVTPPPSFDLVIVDEAHHIRNTATCRHKAVSYFCKNAKAVLFLTATPLQLGNDDLFVLLNTLRPDWVPDKATFAAMAEPNPYVNQAVNAVRGAAGDWRPQALSALEKAKATPWGRAVFDSDPHYRRSVQVLQAESCADHDRVGLITALEALHTFSPLISRTRRR
ncbi:MAG: DEAD/DEAH box helicase, partial [Lentisphaerae bacterium]|nr:DEAD/DEAH box helicase [Lentisphaerota bacterium]